MSVNNLDFFKGKKVLITGHTGFKGSWLCRILLGAGAQIIGYSLPAPTKPALFALAGVEDQIESIIGDVRDAENLEKVFRKANPDIVLHLAAQPIVRDGYKNPRLTYETNVMGIVNVLECVRKSDNVQSFLNVTSDKVYLNQEWEWGYRETDVIDGQDPYSNSKSCSELIAHSYKTSYFADGKPPVSTARAGNVIGGGDFANDRIIPDCVRALEKGETIVVRNPNSIRPYQHVLEPLLAYLMIARKQAENAAFADWYNVGPEEHDCVSTGALVNLFCKYSPRPIRWETRAENHALQEANFLKLDCSRLKTRFGWAPVWDIDMAVRMTCEWVNVWLSNGNVPQEMDREIALFLGDAAKP